MEIWKDIIGFEGLYKISNYGNIYRVRRQGSKGDIVRGSLNSHGYVRIRLSKNNKITGHTIHRLLAVHFIPNDDNKPFVNHKNHIRHDNSLDNLEWVTQRENNSHGCLTRKHQKTSKFIGVYWKKDRSKWHVQGRTGSNKIHLGYFDDPKQASEVYKNWLSSNNIQNKYAI